MAKGKIRGITVEIGGDTTKLGKALDGVNQKSRDLQSELKGVNSLLKLDPSNVDLLRQKQELLTQSINETKNKLNILKETQSQVQAQFERGDITAEQYRDFQREIVATEQKLERLTDQMKEFGAVSAQRIAQAGEGIQSFGQKMTDVGSKMSASVTAPIVGGMVAVAEGTRELRGDLARLEVNAEQAGYSMGDMSEHMTQIVGVTGEVDSSVEGLSNLLATGISPDGFNAIMDSMSGAAIKFSDTLKFEGIADGLQETLATGAAVGPFAELLERSGIVLDDFNEGLEKSIKNGTEENYILETLAKTGLADYYQAYRDGNPDLVKSAEAEYKLQTQLAELAKMIDPIIAEFKDFAAQVLEAFNKMSPEGQKFTMIIVALAAAIGPLIVVIGSVITHVGTILTLAPKFATALNAVKGAFALLNATMAANPIGAVIVAITAVIAILVTAYNKCEWFRNGVNTIVSDVVAFFKSIPSHLSDLPSKMSGIGKNVLEGFWNGIKNIKSWLIGKIKGLGGSVLGAIREAFDTHSPSKETMKIGEDVGEGLAIGLENKAADIADAARGISDIALEGLGTLDSESGDGVVEDSDSSIVTSVVDGMRTEEPIIIGYVEELKNTLIAQINGYRSQYVDIGVMMCSGIAQGVNRGESEIVNAMVRAVKRAIKAAKAAAKIKSPSQEMRDEVGKQLSRGMAVGITDAMNEPVDAMSEAVRGVIGRGVNVSRDINATFTSNTNSQTGEIMSLLTSYLPQIVSASNRQIVLDGGAIVGGTIDTIDARLGQSALLKARGV